MITQTVSELSLELSLKLVGNTAHSIGRLCAPDEIVRGGALALFDKSLISLTQSCADVFFLPEEWIDDISIDSKKSYLFCKNPKKIFITLLQMIASKRNSLTSSLTSEEANKFFSQVQVHSGAIVSKNLSVGKNTFIKEQVFIGDNVKIGKNCTIDIGAKILHDTIIGNECYIGPNTVIGLSGFAYELIDNKMIRIPQVGKVLIEDNVDIDANSCIERGTLGSTKIGNATKIGSLVHIGHNCKIGKNCIIITQTGLAGSCILEDGVILAGQVGVGEHSFIGKNTKVGGKSGIVSRDCIPENSRIWGIPAIPKKQFDKIHQSLLEKFSMEL